MPEISPKAIVEKTAELADDVRVGPFSYIGPEVRIAAGCLIENNVTITGKTTLGPGNNVFPMAVIGTAVEGRSSQHGCTLGRANMIREHVTVYAGSSGPTRIGNDHLIMIGCQVGPGAAIGDHGIFANYTRFGEGSTVADYVRTSGFTAIEPGAAIGAYAFTVGYSSIDCDVPPYATVQGFPFRVRGVNTENLRRCGFAEDDIRALKDVFRELFNGQGPGVDKEVLCRLLALPASNPHVRLLVETINTSLRKAGRQR